jgi:hypothetical protein
MWLSRWTVRFRTGHLRHMMKHMEALTAHNHDGDCREQYSNHDEDKERSLA